MRFSTPYGFYELNPFPCCAQIVVLNHSFIEEKYRGQGLGTKLHAERLKHTQELGYDYCLCTVCSKNTAQIKILERNKWTLLDTFLNRETNNTIKLYGRKTDAL